MLYRILFVPIVLCDKELRVFSNVGEQHHLKVVWLQDMQVMQILHLLFNLIKSVDYLNGSRFLFFLFFFEHVQHFNI